MKKLIYQTGSKNSESSNSYDVFFEKEEMNDTKISLNIGENDHSYRPSYRGTNVGTIEDDGDGVKIQLEEHEFVLNYSQVEYLRLLLHSLTDIDYGNNYNGYCDSLNKFVKYSKKGKK